MRIYLPENLIFTEAARPLAEVNIVFKGRYLRNKFYFQNVHRIMNTSGLLQRIIHDSVNRPKKNFLAYIYIYYKYLNIEIIHNLGRNQFLFNM